MDQPEFPPIVELEADTTVLWDDRLGSILYKHGFYGKPMGLRKATPGDLNRPLVLSLFETLFLKEYGIINVVQNNIPKTVNEVIKYAKSYYEDFERKYNIYKHLRELGYIVRPGMKFGSDFVIYEQGPGIDHSKWVIHVEADQKSLQAIEIVRAGRLAASVKKRYLIATVDQNQSKVFYGFDRVKI